jgi:GNAT superfamily N-acetyltransferase
MPDFPSTRSATPRDAAELSILATRSKAYWGYSEEFMALCREELSLDPEDITDDGVEFVVAVVRETIAGFYALKQLSSVEFDLEALYVDPDHIGHGYGSFLLEHAMSAVQESGGERLLIQSDPNATGFYESAGARQIGTSESGSIPGRFLPLLEIDVSNPDAAIA